MPVTVKYNDNANREYDTLNDIDNTQNVIYLECSYTGLTALPENMYFPSVTAFICAFNALTSLPENICKIFPNLELFNCDNNLLSCLPENMNFQKLEHFDCSYNQILQLPKMINLPMLKKFYCYNNQLSSLPENVFDLFPNIEYFACSYNKLTSLPENINSNTLIQLNLSHNQLTSFPANINIPTLNLLSCQNNKLTSLSENMNFPNLEYFMCNDNQLTSFPVSIMNCLNLRVLNSYNNPIELSPQIERFINRIRHGSIVRLNVYNDDQNIHNSSIQKCVRDSINRITTQLGIPKYNSECMNNMILSDDCLTEHSKQLLIEYCSNDMVHSLLFLTFSEVLWYVLNTIQNDFDSEQQREIKRVLDQEIQDSECKCFTGRINRVINCLNGFSPLVNIHIADGEQIGNIIILERQKLELVGNYSVEQHKSNVEHELSERGYDSKTIDQWLEYIE